MAESYEWIAGIDWGSAEHQVHVMDSSGVTVGERRIKNTGEGLSTLVEWLLKIADGDAKRLAVIIERTDGPLVETLVDRGIATFLIHPKQLDRFRDRHTSAGAKDDRLDALVAADAGRTDLPKLRRIHVAAEDMLMLRELSRLRGSLQDEKLRLCDQLRAQLWRYFPQALDLEAADMPWFWALMREVPSPREAAKTRAATIVPILKKHRVRRITAVEVLEKLQTKPVTVAKGVVEAATMHMRSILGRLDIVDQQLRDTDKAITTLLKTCGALDPGSNEDESSGQKRKHRDAEIIRSLPGFGIHNVAAMLAEAAEPLRDRDYQALCARTGVAPVTKQTGKQRQRSRKNPNGPRPVITMRRACNERLREALYHAGRTASQYDPHCKAIYASARQRGKKHGTATRILARYLLRVMVAMLKTDTLYDPSRRAPGENLEAAA